MAAAYKRLVLSEFGRRDDNVMRECWRKQIRRTSRRPPPEPAQADAAGYVSSIETGRKPGSLRAFKALAEALGVELGDLT